MKEEASFRMFYEKVRASKRKLKIDDSKLLRKEKFRVIMRKEKYLQLRNTNKKANLKDNFCVT